MLCDVSQLSMSYNSDHPSQVLTGRARDWSGTSHLKGCRLVLFPYSARGVQNRSLPGPRPQACPSLTEDEHSRLFSLICS